MTESWAPPDKSDESKALQLALQLVAHLAAHSPTQQAAVTIELDAAAWKALMNETRRPYRPEPSCKVVPHPSGYGSVTFRRGVEAT